MGIYSDVWFGIEDLISDTSALDQVLVVPRIEELVGAVETEVADLTSRAALRSFTDALETSRGT